MIIEKFLIPTDIVFEPKVFEEDNELYSPTIEKYKLNEFWGIWSVPIGKSKASDFLPKQNVIDYSIENIEDYDLNTAWLVPEHGIGQQYIDFELEIGEGVYQFYGICNVFNGYCKSLKLWEANSRVKRLKVYMNYVAICYVELLDTWHFQGFDISQYFPETKLSDNGGVLRFEIVEIFPGLKYKEVGFSELLCDGTGN